MGRVLVTGGTGFLGEQVVRVLLDQGNATPRVFVRSPTRLFDGDDVEVVYGDVLNNEQLARALEGCEGVFHLAGVVSVDPADGQRMMRLHVDGTRQLLHAAEKAGIKRVVVASTSGTVAVSTGSEVHDEESGYATSVVAGWPYYASKLYQEKLALEWAKQQNLEVVVVNPSLLLGPGDHRLSSTGNVRKYLKGQIPVVPKGGLNFVDVRDAALATVDAFSRGKSGERYLLGGPNWTFREFFGRVGRIANQSQPQVQLPRQVIRWGARCLEQAYRIAGREPPIDAVSVEMGEHFWYVDSSKAKRELGFTTRDPSLTLADTVRYLQKGL